MKIFCRSACSIEFDDRVVLTGGWDFGATNRVAVYNVDGFVEYLPDLNHMRQDHGCGQYIDGNDRIVGNRTSKKV